MQVLSHEPILENIVIFALRAWFLCSMVKHPWVSSVKVTLKLKLCSGELTQAVQLTWFYCSLNLHLCVSVTLCGLLHICLQGLFISARTCHTQRKEGPSVRFVFYLTQGLCFSISQGRGKSSVVLLNKILGHNDTCQSMK